jgi:translation initiation factor 3 subunit L
MLADGSQVKSPKPIVLGNCCFTRGQVWSAYSVLNVLYSLIQKSKINEFILAKQQSKSEAEIA